MSHLHPSLPLPSLPSLSPRWSRSDSPLSKHFQAPSYPLLIRRSSSCAVTFGTSIHRCGSTRAQSPPPFVCSFDVPLFPLSISSFPFAIHGSGMCLRLEVFCELLQVPSVECFPPFNFISVYLCSLCPQLSFPYSECQFFSETTIITKWQNVACLKRSLAVFVPQLSHDI